MTDTRYLIVGPSWVGDMVMAQSLFKLLKQRQPNARINVLAPAWSLPVLERMSEVGEGIEMPLGHGQLGLSTRRHLGHRLRARGYTHAIVLPRSFKAALVPWHARIPIRRGFRGEFRFGLINDTRALDKSHLDQTVKRFVALGLDSGEALPPTPTPSLDIDSDAQAAARARLGLGDTSNVIGLLPGAEYGPAKCWPLAHFAAVAREMLARGFAVWVMGGPKDVEAGQTIVQMAGEGVQNLCGQTNLAEAIDLLAACKAVVSNDSGLMHVAAAVGTHVSAVYGSSSPVFTPPLTAHKHIHYLAIECSPCFARECRFGHLRCLHQITPQHVLAGLPAAD